MVSGAGAGAITSIGMAVGVSNVVSTTFGSSVVSVVSVVSCATATRSYWKHLNI